MQTGVSGRRHPHPCSAMSPALPAVGTANIPEQTPPCPVARTSACVPHTYLSPGESLRHAQTPHWGHPQTCVYLMQPTPSPGGWSIPEYLIHGRADVSSADLGNREKPRARRTGRPHEQPVVHEPTLCFGSTTRPLLLNQQQTNWSGASPDPSISRDMAGPEGSSRSCVLSPGGCGHSPRRGQVLLFQALGAPKDATAEHCVLGEGVCFCLSRHNFHQEQCLKADHCVTARGTHRLVPSSHQVFCSLHLEVGPGPGAEQEKTGGVPGRLTGLREFISPKEPPRHGILLALYGFTEVNLTCDTLCFLPQIRSLLASVLKHLHFFSPIQRELLKQIQLCVS